MMDKNYSNDLEEGHRIGFRFFVGTRISNSKGKLVRFRPTKKAFRMWNALCKTAFLVRRKGKEEGRDIKRRETNVSPPSLSSSDRPSNSIVVMNKDGLCKYAGNTSQEGRIVGSRRGAAAACLYFLCEIRITESDLLINSSLTETRKKTIGKRNELVFTNPRSDCGSIAICRWRTSELAEDQCTGVVLELRTCTETIDLSKCRIFSEHLSLVFASEIGWIEFGDTFEMFSSLHKFRFS